MKLLAVAAVFAALTFLASAQDEESTCPDELKSAADRAFKICGPLFKCGKGGQGGPGGPRGGPGGPRGGPRESRRRRQDDAGDAIEQEAARDPEKAKIYAECIAGLEAEEAFTNILETCPRGEEKRMKCIFGEFREECPNYRPPRREGPPPA